MTKNAKIGAALVGGYLLGRTKKAKLAIGFGMFLAGKKLDLDPKKIGSMLASSPVLGGLSDQVRKDLVGATRTAATNALTQRATSFADSLHQRTLRLDDPEAAREEEQRDADDVDDRAEDEAHEPEHRDEEPGEKSERKPARSGKSSSARGGSGSGGSSDSAPKKKAASTARRTTSQARAKAPAKKTAAKSRSTRGGSRD
ncbi:hypothetical protein CLM85_16865 [Streptomyces albidoflavus]|uniref:hypothetical protein n=1 Tax=Streptomyces albidoflavus TaxID=1886 RepID=UPI000BAE3C7E|nr:hypothetical protein [Streptomyces albidoflavus]PAX85445.1 hypothetical protein CLM81_13000 [Streptomyces albidoflavus]PAX91783.1 hypothetical protein CLM82_07290 [Streptomyces albidoflavus]PBO18393.1 hypothetical protein CLM83_12630 [Streptomyces albidoflavus]PBO23304.1 hypothetical protein CLM85_16865 [Streptomyces albidoflavus]PBO27246.1 hypothetical protein CLM84_26805 [Streptomyces albidoflavus]